MILTCNVLISFKINMLYYTENILVPSNCTIGDIRLVGGLVPEKGRVEICLSRVWASISRYGFNHDEAQVVCTQLGYSGSKYR